jgi:hypothetical protein
MSFALWPSTRLRIGREGRYLHTDTVRSNEPIALGLRLRDTAALYVGAAERPHRPACNKFGLGGKVGLFSKKNPAANQPAAASKAASSSKGPTANSDPPETIDPALPDGAWLSQSEALFDRTVGGHYGSPDTLAGGGVRNYEVGNFGTAMFFFQKSIDLMHTNYGFGGMSRRKPSQEDASIIDGFLTSLEASLRQHPQADVSASVRQVTHRLRSIAGECEQKGMPSGLYRQALERLAQVAPDVNVADVRWS